MKDTSFVYYINAKKTAASRDLGSRLQSFLSCRSDHGISPVILCIGTDRVTGDSLGPLVGTFLMAYGTGHHLPVYGTLDAPIHALNLEDAYRQIKKKHPRNPIVAVDASLGTKRHLGYITVGQGSLQPGAGVCKKLTSIGDIFITGIINTAVPEAQMALQNTRLASVASLACCIAHGILYACCPCELVAASRDLQPSPREKSGSALHFGWN